VVEDGTIMQDSIEISVRGQWITVPVIHVNGAVIVVNGRHLQVATVHDEEWLEGEIADPEACVERLKERHSPGWRADIFTFTQKLPSTVPIYAYPMEWDSVAAIRLSTLNDWWVNLPQESRKNVRRSKRRGVEVSVQGLNGALLCGIAAVNDDSFMRQGRPNAHYRKTLEQVLRDHISFLDRSDFVCAYAGQELIGYVKVVYRGNVASILNLAVKVSQYDKRPANALLAGTVELCTARQIQYLTYGKYNYGNKRGDSLSEFKRRNGFEEILVPRYYIPLTRWGAFAMKLGLHRGVVGMLPTTVVTIGTRVRARWYKLAHRMSRRSSMIEQPSSNRRMERSNPPAGSNT
jgi:hypothetical protein